MDLLKIRAYNVGFGDALLVEVPDRAADGRTHTRRILIDVGNVLAGEGGRDELFEPVLRDLERNLDGEPIDVYVMTHEHMDHVQGLFHGATRLAPPVELRVRQAWLTASAEGDAYYRRFPEARRKRLALEDDYRRVGQLLEGLRAAGQPVPAAIDVFMANNNPRSTRECVDYLRRLGELPPRYVYAGCDLSEATPFEEPGTRIDVWAPLEDAAGYYGRFHGLNAGSALEGDEAGGPALLEIEPPEGVDPESFRNLVEVQRSGYFESLLAIDRAANNTSVVFLLEWRGWKLLFPGDAELRSWKTMARADVLEPVHFLKVAHHGSENGTPRGELLDRVLPAEPVDGRERMALVSTCHGTYHGVPDAGTRAELARRGLRIVAVDEQVEPGGYVEITFPSDGGAIGTREVEAESLLVGA